MLVLSRHTDEIVDLFLHGIKIAEVTVVELRGDRVRLGFAAGPEITIHRREVSNAIERENRLKIDGTMHIDRRHER